MASSRCLSGYATYAHIINTVTNQNLHIKRIDKLPNAVDENRLHRRRATHICWIVSFRLAPALVPVLIAIVELGKFILGILNEQNAVNKIALYSMHEHRLRIGHRSASWCGHRTGQQNIAMLAFETRPFCQCKQSLLRRGLRPGPFQSARDTTLCLKYVNTRITVCRVSKQVHS